MKYSNLKCGKCQTPVNIDYDKYEPTLTKPSEVFNTLHCNQCRINFSKSEIDTKYYTYIPKYCSYNKNGHEIGVFCLNCYIEKSPNILGWIVPNEDYNQIQKDEGAFMYCDVFFGIKDKCFMCYKQITYSKQYIEEQIKKINIQDLDYNTYTNPSNMGKIALFKYP